MWTGTQSRFVGGMGVEMREFNPVKDRKTREIILDFLLEIPLFDKFELDELRTMAKYMNYLELVKNETLFKEGEKGDYICFVVEGTMDVAKETGSGKNVVISQLPKGRSIGEMSIIDGCLRSATVRAATDSKLVVLTSEGFETILKEHPTVGIFILRKVSRLLSLNLRKTSSQLAEYMLPLE